MNNDTIKHKFCIHCGKELEYYVLNCPECGYKQPIPKINKAEISESLFSEWVKLLDNKSIISAIFNKDYWVVVIKEYPKNSNLTTYVAITKDFKEFNILKKLTCANEAPAATVSIDLYKVKDTVFVVTEWGTKLYFINQNLQLSHVLMPIDTSSLHKFEIRDVVSFDNKIVVCASYGYTSRIGFLKKDYFFSGVIIGGKTPSELKLLCDFRNVFKDSSTHYNYTDSNGVVVSVVLKNIPGKGWVDDNHGIGSTYRTPNLLRWEKMSNEYASNYKYYMDTEKFSYRIHEEGGGFAFLDIKINTAENVTEPHEENIKIYFPDEYGDFVKGEVLGIDHAFIQLVDNKVFMFRPYTKTAYVCEFRG